MKIDKGRENLQEQIGRLNFEKNTGEKEELFVLINKTYSLFKEIGFNDWRIYQISQSINSYSNNMLYHSRFSLYESFEDEKYLSKESKYVNLLKEAVQNINMDDLIKDFNNTAK